MEFFTILVWATVILPLGYESYTATECYRKILGLNLILHKNAKDRRATDITL